MMTTISLTLDDVELQCLVTGPEDGPLAVCLHGFPDTPHTFRFLAPHLAARCYRVVAPWMRGYAPSSVSRSNNYQVAALASDANQIHERFGGDDRALLIGHDWGAAGTYLALGGEPTRWSRAVTMAVPPLAAMGQAFLSVDQLKASWYMFFFQSPLAEMVFDLDNLSLANRLWREWSPNYDPSADLEHVRLALANPSNQRAALGYYRAMFDQTALDPATEHLQASAFAVPSVRTLYLHGAQDGCVHADSLGDPLQFLAPGSTSRILANAGHFLHLEQPGEVHRIIDEFLASA